MNEGQNSDAEIDLAHFLDVFLRRRWIILSVLVVAVTLTALVTFTTKPVYRASAMLVIEKERGGGAVYSNGAAVENSADDYYQTQYKLLQSYSLLQKVYDTLQLQDVPSFKQPHGVDKLKNTITIAPVPRSRLVFIHVDSNDPALAARISNALSEAFVSENIANQLFISKEILQALQIKQGSPNARQTYDALPAVVNNPLIQQLKGEYVKLDAQAAEMSQRFTPKYPAMLALRSNMAALKAQIDAETEKIVQSLKTELSGQLKGNNVRIIDPARVPDKPIKPRKAVALALGLFAGLFGGFSIALLIEAIDQSVRTQEDVENRLGLPFLGLVPQTAKQTGAVFDALFAKELSLSSEAIRNMRTMIDFAEVSQKDSSLIVTSTVQSEGKSYVAANLAVAFAQLGENVLLIDGDLRRPSVHKNFSLSAKQGLCDFLAHGKDVTEVEKLLQSSVLPNLKVLTCGPRPPNPSEMLNTPRVGALVAWARERFDRLVVDCTPMFPINDTMLWARHIKSGVYVVRYGKTRVPLINKGAAKLASGGMKVLGVAVNAARAGGLAYSSYGYYYQQYYHAYHQESTAGKAS